MLRRRLANGHLEEQIQVKGEQSASATVTTQPPLLTAEFLEAPESHDGESSFTFELRFSEDFGLSYKTLRDHAFTVAGGSVEGARRMDRDSNVGCRITVRPDGDVTVVLTVTTDCADDGAICTDDGRMLSHRRDLTVSGPESQVPAVADNRVKPDTWTSEKGRCKSCADPLPDRTAGTPATGLPDMG